MPAVVPQLDTRKRVDILKTVMVLSKSAPIESLGLSPGVHHLKVVVADETVSIEVESKSSGADPELHMGSGFVAAWGGSARKVESPADEWLTHINEKHLR